MHCIQQLQRVLMAQNITFHVRVAADDNLHAVMRTAFQYNRRIFTAVSAIAARSYRSLVQLNQHTMLQAVRQGLDACLDRIPDVLPQDVRERCRLAQTAYAYENIHFPKDFDALELARRRLI